MSENKRKGRGPSPERVAAFNLYKAYNGNITPKEMEDKLGVKRKVISVWKNKDKWDEKIKDTRGNNPDNDSIMISIMDMEREYYTDISRSPITIEQLSEKYGMSASAISEYSSKFNWVEKRKKYREEIAARTFEKVVEMTAEDIAKIQHRLVMSQLKVLGIVEGALENPDEPYMYVEKVKQFDDEGSFSEDIIEKRMGAVNTQRMNQIADILAKTQKSLRQSLGVIDAKDLRKLDIEERALVMRSKEEEKEGKQDAFASLNAAIQQSKKLLEEKKKKEGEE